LGGLSFSAVCPIFLLDLNYGYFYFVGTQVHECHSAAEKDTTGCVKTLIQSLLTFDYY